MADTSPDKPLIAVLGPTAVGKTSLGIVLARRLGGEIISADSRQVYRKLDIGTAKPSAEERVLVRHHFVDERDLVQPYSAGAFAEDARARIEEIRARNHIPIVVGGSTLYVHALLEGLADIPSIPARIRQRVRQELKEFGPAGLYELLVQADPEGAAAVDPGKTRRVQRMLEVFYTTGKSITSFWKTSEVNVLRSIRFVLSRDRKTLYDRIDRRTEAMFEAGLMNEVAGILASGVDPELSPLQTIGYQECFSCLRGEISLEEARLLVARNTRRYAKRQLTWFRRYSDAVWMDIEPSRVINEIADEMIAIWEKP